MNIADRMSAQAISDLVDRLVATARAELGPGVVVEKTEDGVALEGARLALRRIGDVRLRDLCATAVRAAEPDA